MSKYKLNILISILAIIAIISAYFVSYDQGAFILALIFVGSFYIGKNNIKNKVVKKILEIISAMLFLAVSVVAFLFLTVTIINVVDELPNISLSSFDIIFTIVNIYFLFRIGIDAFRDYKNKKFEFASWLKVITLVIINLVLFRLLLCKLFLKLDTSLLVDQNSPYFFMMLASCMISSIDFSKKMKVKFEDIMKLLIGIIVSLTIFSLIDTLEIYTSSDEHKPLICFHETHSDEKSTYYSFGYSITYHYGEEVVAEYRLFNLIPFYKR